MNQDPLEVMGSWSEALARRQGRSQWHHVAALGAFGEADKIALLQQPKYDKLFYFPHYVCEGLQPLSSEWPNGNLT